MSDLRIDNKIIKTDEFREFSWTKGYPIWTQLAASIVRGPLYTGPVNMYDKYYKQGLLAARWSQEDIAEMFKVKQPRISKLIKPMVKQGFIKIDRVVTDYGNMNFYILGTHNFSKQPEEIYLYEIMKKYVPKEESDADKELNELQEKLQKLKVRSYKGLV